MRGDKNMRGTSGSSFEFCLCESAPPLFCVLFIFNLPPLPLWSLLTLPPSQPSADSFPGFRSLILAPTRELALQTLKFAKELGKFVGLQAVVILGGEKIEDQFAAIHSNPDVIIATPGRFLHVVLEMDLNLSSGSFGLSFLRFL